MDPDALRALHRRAVDAGLADPATRRLLLVGLPDSLIAAIPQGGSPAVQLWLDLQTLARHGTGAASPLVGWLRNAAHHLPHRVEQRAFAELADRVAGGVERRSPVSGLHPLRFEPPARDFVEAHARGALLQRCTAGLQWPLRARLGRLSDGSHCLAIVSVLARDAGRRVLLDALPDGTLVLERAGDGAQSSGSGLFHRPLSTSPDEVRAAIGRYFEGGETTS